MSNRGRRKESLQAIRDAGFPWPDRLLHVFIGGSELHGAKVKDTDDMDIYGAYIEPPEFSLGLEQNQHFVWSSSGQHERNGPDDIDVTLYSLRKWARLACKGNPTALHFLFAENLAAHPMWTEILRYKHFFLARGHMKAFYGFADAQLGRLTGARGRGQKGQRPELEQRYGYDVKAGMHVMRLLHEGIELMRTGHITLPRPEKDLLIHVRTGGWSQERLLTEANRLFAEAKQAEAKSKLPEEVERKRVSELITRLYLENYRSPN